MIARRLRDKQACGGTNRDQEFYKFFDQDANEKTLLLSLNSSLRGPEAREPSSAVCLVVSGVASSLSSFVVFADVWPLLVSSAIVCV